MGLVSPILRQANGNDGGGPRYIFWCPGCKEAHQVATGGGPGPRWSFNGNVDRPTFTPSVLIRSGHFIPGHENECWCKYDAEHPDDASGFKCAVCHSFITDGRIQFLPDSTHHLAGQTVDIPVWPY